MMDLHCHLDLYPDPRAVTAACVERSLYVLSVTTVPSAFEGTVALAPADGRIKTALGLHPELAVGRVRELPLFEQLLPRTRYVGEIGLDGSRDHRASLDTQRGVFDDLLRLCARAGGKIISLHSRGAVGIILDAIEAQPSAGVPILHWYNGSAKQISRAAGIGCWFSIGPAMFASERGRTAVSNMRRDRLLPESDGPFGLVDGRPALPWEAWSIVPMLADLWREPQGNVELILRSNLKSLLATPLK